MFSSFSIFLFFFSILSSVFNNNIHYFSFSLKKDMCKEIFSCSMKMSGKCFKTLFWKINFLQHNFYCGTCAPGTYRGAHIHKRYSKRTFHWWFSKGRAFVVKCYNQGIWMISIYKGAYSNLLHHCMKKGISRLLS